MVQGKHIRRSQKQLPRQTPPSPSPSALPLPRRQLHIRQLAHVQVQVQLLILVLNLLVLLSSNNQFTLAFSISSTNTMSMSKSVHKLATSTRRSSRIAAAAAAATTSTSTTSSTITTKLQLASSSSSSSSSPIPSPKPESNTKSKPKSKFDNVRIELFFKTEKDLKERVEFLSSGLNSNSGGVYKFNLVNKSRQDTVTEWVDTILSQSNNDQIENENETDTSTTRTTFTDSDFNDKYCRPGVSVCAHYSLKFNKGNTRKNRDDGTYHKFISFLQSIEELLSQLDRGGNNKGDEDNNNSDIDTNNSVEVLLVNGSGEKAKMDPVAILQRIKRDKELYLIDQQQKQEEGTTLPNTTAMQQTRIPHIPMAVAYNPFFPTLEQREIENKRLIEKIESNQIHKVYLQFGTNLELLSSSLQFLTELNKSNNDNNKGDNASDGNDEPQRPKFKICGSIFLPTKKLIAQQKFRPWNGVYLSNEFLNSEEDAYGIVLQLLKLYKSYNCEVVIEAPGVRNKKDLQLVEQLLDDSKFCFDDSSNDISSDDKDNNSDGDGTKRGEEEDGGKEGRCKKSSSGRSNNKNDEQKSDDLSSVPTKRRRTALPNDDTIAITPKRIAPVRIDPPSSLVPVSLFQRPALLLFGTHDLRLHDNLAFQLSTYHRQIIPLFLWDSTHECCGTALEVVLKDALRNLETKLSNHGLKLVCRNTNDVGEDIYNICQETDSYTIYWNKQHTTEGRISEDKLSKTLTKQGITTVPCQSTLLYDPMEVSLKSGFSGGHFATLMPFLKGCKKQLGEPRRPIPKYETFALLGALEGPKQWPKGISVNDLDLGIIKGKVKWDLPILERFPMSEENAANELDNFMDNGFYDYEKERSRADLRGSTSKLSPHLRLGTLSPNELYYRVEDSSLSYDEKKTFSRRLFWRDLAYYQLLNFPNMNNVSIRGHYEHTEWCAGEEEKRRFDAWKKGQTGYPLVDAGMRELYKTGWMTQSVRMVVASFLTEYLRVNWVKGCEWFQYTLVDADPSINAMMWQNAGRSGIDQWNFVMSPVAASQDHTGSYTKEWCPELSKLSKPLLHKPWEASDEALLQAGIVLGETYPHRIVTDLVAERARSVQSVLDMRRKHQEYNDRKGYDLINLPSGEKTVVFTKKEYRIDGSGEVIKIDTTKRRQSKNGKGRGRRGRNQPTKVKSK